MGLCGTSQWRGSSFAGIVRWANCVGAAREMEEEIGYHAGKLETLLPTATTGAFSHECIDVYLAMHLQKTVQHLDEEEILNVECWELEDLCQMIFSGELIDAKTIAAILAYKVYKNKRVGI